MGQEVKGGDWHCGKQGTSKLEGSCYENISGRRTSCVQLFFNDLYARKRLVTLQIKRADVADLEDTTGKEKWIITHRESNDLRERSEK